MRLSSRDAKWFTRIILKSLLPVTLEPDNLFREFHFLLPEIWRIRGQLESALSVLGSKTFRLFPCAPSPDDEEELREAAERLLLPEVGVKVGRPVFVKALSCEKVIRMAGRKTWALERKYDGGMPSPDLPGRRDTDSNDSRILSNPYRSDEGQRRLVKNIQQIRPGFDARPYRLSRNNPPMPPPRRPHKTENKTTVHPRSRVFGVL